MSKKSGFTLVELLIVISIIAILSTIGLVAYGTFLKNARDAKRQADLKFIQSSLEEYFADQRFYPTQVIPGTPLTNPSASKTYLGTIPNDPVKNPDYLYQALPGTCDNSEGKPCTNYCLFTTLEGTQVYTSSTACTPLPPSYKYGITRP